MDSSCLTASMCAFKFLGNRSGFSSLGMLYHFYSLQFR